MVGRNMNHGSSAGVLQWRKSECDLRIRRRQNGKFSVWSRGAGGQLRTGRGGSSGLLVSTGGLRLLDSVMVRIESPAMVARKPMAIVITARHTKGRLVISLTAHVVTETNPTTSKILSAIHSTARAVLMTSSVRFHRDAGFSANRPPGTMARAASRTRYNRRDRPPGPAESH